jgi:HKD family nuclease
MEFYIQSPFNNSTSLIETIDQSAENSISGGASFAFSTSEGIEELLTKTSVSSLISNTIPSFHLIVGTDEITDVDAVNKLVMIANENTGLTPQLFFHRENRLFHPKFCWFEYESGAGCLITGSGNLTGSGMFDNWEAFTKHNLTTPELEQFKSQWSEFLSMHDDFLRALNDHDALIKVGRNVRASTNNGTGSSDSNNYETEKPTPTDGSRRKSRQRRTGRHFIRDGVTGVIADTTPNVQQEGGVRAFIREAMTARERGDYSQILFGIDIFTNFFGFSLDGENIITSYDVYDHSGIIGSVTYPSITPKQSNNYAIGIASKTTPTAGRGISNRTIKNNFMVVPTLINRTPPILLFIEHEGNYKVVFTHPSNQLGEVHSELRRLLGQSRELIIDQNEVERLVGMHTAIDNMMT